MLVRCPRPQVSTSTNPGAGNRRSDLLRVTGWWQWAGGSHPYVSSAVPRSWATSVGPSRVASGSPPEVLAFGVLGGGGGLRGKGRNWLLLRKHWVRELVKCARGPRGLAKSQAQPRAILAQACSHNQHCPEPAHFLAPPPPQHTQKPRLAPRAGPQAFLKSNERFWKSAGAALPGCPPNGLLCPAQPTSQALTWSPGDTPARTAKGRAPRGEPSAPIST